MTPIPPLRPDLQSSLVCDDIRREACGKLILIGIFDRLSFQGAFPVTLMRICVANRWCCGTGSFVQQTVLYHSDGTTPIARGRPVEIKLEDETSSATAVEIFLNVTFPSPGIYWMEITLDGEIKLRYPLAIGAAATRQ